MNRRTAGRVAKPRICAGCQGVMTERRPVFLVATTAGTIVGPYHAGCAERVVLAAKRNPISNDLAPYAERFGEMVPREETLPW